METTTLTVEQALTLAVEKLNTGALQEAEQLGLSILQTQPNHADAFHILGTVAQLAGHHQQAVELFHQALTIAGSHAPLYHALGINLSQLSRHKEALVALERSHAMDGNNVQLLVDLASVHHTLGDAAQAIKFLDQALTLDPSHADGFCRRGNAHRELADLERASQDYLTSLSLNADVSTTHVEYGRLRLMQGRMLDALKLFRHGAQLAPSSPYANQWLEHVVNDCDQRVQQFRHVGQYYLDRQDARQAATYFAHAHTFDLEARHGTLEPLESARHQAESQYPPQTPLPCTAPDTPVKLVWISTPPRTGSSWTYNVVRAIFKASGRQVQPAEGYVDEDEAIELGLKLANRPTPELEADDSAWVLKVHASVLPCSPNAIRIISCIRDPRDVLVSFRRFMRVDFERALQAAESVLTFHDLYGNYPPSLVHLLDYREIGASPEALIGRMAAFLGVSLTAESITEIAQRFSRRNVKQIVDKMAVLDDASLAKVERYHQGDSYRMADRETAFNTDHISADPNKDWRQRLSENEKRVVEARFGPWLRAHGYPEV
ncbi:MAG: sulfotransferase domain-containing protein [Magnetococcales bacterium]|nr:sulfotransferase domain-containing protein [Magnetococcales bacterium]